jgi:hypothetical protein
MLNSAAMPDSPLRSQYRMFVEDGIVLDQYQLGCRASLAALHIGVKVGHGH